MSDLYETLKIRIKNLEGVEFSIDVINEVKNIYEEFKSIVLATPNLNMKYSDRMNLVDTFKKLFGLVLKNKLDVKYPFLNPLVVEKIISGIEDARLDIKDILVYADYVFICGRSIDDFSHDVVSYNANKELIDITSVNFINMKNNRGLYIELFNLYNDIVKLLNQVISIRNLEERPQSFVIIDENKMINYGKPRFHVYMNNDLATIISDVKEHGLSRVDIIIEDNSQKYDILELTIYSDTMEMNEKDVNIWKLSGEKEKCLSKVARDC